MNFLSQQYQYVIGSRKIVFQQISELSVEELTKPIASFNNKDILFQLIHIHQVYQHWIKGFALQQKVTYTSQEDVSSVNQLVNLFNETDQQIEEFFRKYNNQWERFILGKVSDRNLSLTPLQVFTHVITHEFHHKGQIMTTFRLLGKTPLDTDVIRF